MMRNAVSLAMIAGTLLLAGARPAIAQTYTFTDLGQSTSGSSGYSVANGVNNAGQVVGASTFTSIDDSTRFATLWSNGVAANLGAMVPRLNGNSAAFAISPTGQSVGYAPFSIDNTCSCWNFGIAWDGVTSATVLPNFPNSGPSLPLVGVGTANAINSAGLVVGFSAAGNPSTNFVGFSRAAAWSSGSAIDLGVLANYGASYANGVNDAGLIVGWSQPVGNFLLPTQRATTWNGILGIPTDLGALTGASGRSVANAVNSVGQIVGWTDTPSGRPHAFTFQSGTMTDLGTLPGFPSSQANAINSRGVIVGTSAVPALDGNVQAHAIMWDGGAMTDLNSMLSPIDAGAGWVLKSANGINDNGWIVGEAMNTNTGHSHAFQLVPAAVRTAQVQQPINADGSSVFKASRGAIPVVFTLAVNGTSTCDLPAATISVARTSGGTVGTVDESVYIMAADSGSNFRVADCQYVYNLGAKALGVGTYRIDLKINGQVAGSGVFGLR